MAREQRPFRRLLIANRGEIATRILSTASELDLETHTIFTSNDAGHTIHADHAHECSNASIYMDIAAIISISKKYSIDAVHPGYGFLSESEEFAERMWNEAGVAVIGPGQQTLARTSDKLKARALAEECGVPVTPGILEPTDDFNRIASFAEDVGYPVMVKAVDGGGGRGIRLIRKAEELESNMKRAIEESPSRKVFAEKAAIDGFRHVEVQVIGDGTGDVRHVWERECSIQRRYQKIVEQAPSSMADRSLAAKIIESALEMARKINYRSLGTFEFLASPPTSTFYFLEVNPRLQVEHTVTESLLSTDLVRLQLLIAQGHSLSSLDAQKQLSKSVSPPPPLYSIQLRITAEDPTSNWSLSVGKIKSFSFPAGNGIRVDTHLSPVYPTVISTDFDSLIAKVIVTAPTWPAVIAKARRALKEASIDGVKTNLSILRAILDSQDFAEGRCDTTWLDTHLPELLEQSKKMQSTDSTRLPTHSSPEAASSTSTSVSSLLFRKGDAWTIELAPKASSEESPGSKAQQKNVPAAEPERHHLEITRILRNEFPTSLALDLAYTISSASSQSKPVMLPFSAKITATSASANVATSNNHRRADPSDPSHVMIPFSGKLIEFLVDTEDEIAEGDVVCVVQQMKMELEVRSARAGRVTWAMEVDEGDEVGEGILACIVEGREKKL